MPDIVHETTDAASPGIGPDATTAAEGLRPLHWRVDPYVVEAGDR